MQTFSYIVGGQTPSIVVLLLALEFKDNVETDSIVDGDLMVEYTYRFRYGDFELFYKSTNGNCAILRSI